jgi:hypothetical protein
MIYAKLNDTSRFEPTATDEPLTRRLLLPFLRVSIASNWWGQRTSPPVTTSGGMPRPDQLRGSGWAKAAAKVVAKVELATGRTSQTRISRGVRHGLPKNMADPRECEAMLAKSSVASVPVKR